MAKLIDPHTKLKQFCELYATQKEAAKALGIGAVYLGELLRGSRAINDKMLAKLGLKRAAVLVDRS